MQVGWRRSGLGLWTPSGCRLVCSLRQARAQAGAQPRSLNSLYRANAPLSLEVREPAIPGVVHLLLPASCWRMALLDLC